MFYKKAIFLLIGCILLIFSIRIITGLLNQNNTLKKQNIPMQVALPQPDVLEVMPQDMVTTDKKYFSKIQRNSKAILKHKQETNRKPKFKEIQKALKNAGFNPGPLDGKNGPQTKTAIKDFQKKYRLSVDGIAGLETWEVLRKFKNKE